MITAPKQIYTVNYYSESTLVDSQEVEEILRAMPNYIREEERRSVPRTLNEEDIQKLLLSKDYYDLLAALEALRKIRLEDGFQNT